MTPLLELQDIHKGFFGVPVLKGISLSLEPGQVLALIGENGAGKSTLMNILGGLLRADRGTLRVQGQPYAPDGPQDARRAGIAFIHQELNLFTNLSIAENIFITDFPGRGLIDRAQMLARTRALLGRVELDLAPDTRVERLAPGERQLVEIAKALNTRARLIIFDEPTTSLTKRETGRLFALMNRLRGEGTAMIYISHVLDDVKRVADHLAVLRDGTLTAQGSAGDFDIGRMISSMVGRELTSLYPARTNRPAEGREPLLEVRGLSQPGLVRDIHLQVRPGEVVGIFGLMGSGRTELARMVFGVDGYGAGEVRVGGQPLPPNDPVASIRRGLAFVTENRREEGLLMDMSIFENMGLATLNRYASGGFLRLPQLNAFLGTLFGSLRVRSVSPQRQAVRSLSGGNQQKVVLGKWLATHPHLFILDEPTRGIDVGAKFEVYGVINDLATRGNGVLVISSELEELMGISDRILVMATGEVQAEFAGPEYAREDILRAAFREGVGGPRRPPPGQGASA